MLGDDVEYEMVWSSIYTFLCRRMEKFRHNRVIFAGGSTHQVSPFGARGAHSGLQDVDNLGWKLGLVVNGTAPASLLDSYDEERVFRADENILNSNSATDFITPKSKTSQTFRNAVLSLSEKHEFARPLVNSGRLSVPCVYDKSSLNGADALPRAPSQTRVGGIFNDAPLRDGFLLNHLGDDFVVLTINTDAPDGVEVDGIKTRTLHVSTSDDPTGALAQRYLGEADIAVYLVRPDQHVAARWPSYGETKTQNALRKGLTMAHLNTKPNIADPNDFYADLIAAFDGKTDEESEASTHALYWFSPITLAIAAFCKKH